MNIKKFTQKSLEAINGSEKFATDYGNQEITESHLLLSFSGRRMASSPGSLRRWRSILIILKKMWKKWWRPFQKYQGAARTLLGRI